MNQSWASLDNQRSVCKRLYCSNELIIMPRWAEPRGIYYASVGGAMRHTVIVLSVSHYASVGGATRHTVIVLSVTLSVTPFLRRTQKGKL